MVTISFLGDISLNDKYNELYLNGDNPFDNVKQILFNSDFVVGNLECLAKGVHGENLLKKPRLKTNLDTLNYLKDLNLGIVSLAHNHIYDNLRDGYEKTIDLLDKNNIRHLGSGLSETIAKKPIIIEINNIKFCFLNYVTHDTNPSLPNDADIYLNWFDENNICNEINQYKNQVDHIIILLHWGGKLEGGYYPDFDQPHLAHRLVDAGADLIIGTHSHTLQPYEIYNGKYIFYSLGNFCFADVYSDNKLIEINQKKGTESIILNVLFKKDSYSIKFFPIKNKNLHIEIDNKIIKKYKIRLFYYKFIKNIKIFWYLYYFKFKKIDPIIFYFFGNNHNFFNQFKLLNFDKIKRFIKK